MNREIYKFLKLTNPVLAITYKNETTEDIIEKKFVKANKEWICKLCRSVIKKGEKYFCIRYARHLRYRKDQYCQLCCEPTIDISKELKKNKIKFIQKS